MENKGKEPSLILLEGTALERTIRRMAHEIAEHAPSGEEIVFAAVEGAGVEIAHRLSEEVFKTFNLSVPVYCWKREGILETDRSFEKTFTVLIDDVVFSGATIVRLILSKPEILKASTVRVAALVDRGHRKFPIQADFVGLVAPTKLDEHIEVFYSAENKRVVLFK